MQSHNLKDDSGYHNHSTVRYINLHFDDVKVPFLVTLFLLVAGGMKTIFHLSRKLIKVVPESCFLVILGESTF